MAKQTKSASAMTSAIREQNEMLGYHRDKAPNEEAEAAKAKLMTAEQAESALIAAKMRTDALSGPKTVPIRERKQA